MNKSPLSIFPLDLPTAMSIQKPIVFGAQDSDPSIGIHHFCLHRDKRCSNWHRRVTNLPCHTSLSCHLYIKMFLSWEKLLCPSCTWLTKKKKKACATRHMLIFSSWTVCIHVSLEKYCHLYPVSEHRVQLQVCEPDSYREEVWVLLRLSCSS